MKRCNKYLFTSLLAASMLFSSYKSVHAHDNIDEKGKVHLYWQGNYYVDNYVDYTKALTADEKSIEWTVTFNSAKEQWVYPDFSVFLPKGVKAPKEITYEHYYWDGTVDSKKRSNTQWHYDWENQKTNFNQEFDKFPGYTGWSPSLDKFYKLKNDGKFSHVLVDTYGRQSHTYFSHKMVWKFKTELEEDYKNKWDKLPFIAGIKQNNPLAASFPSYKGEFGE
ncbi:TPA: hypothetical protein VIU92_001165 [Streptococcus pyogenes]|nr:hypothetical protein [Streptococcus pyogenes]